MGGTQISSELEDAGEPLLWPRLADGDADARMALFDLHAPFARGIARRYIRDKSRGDLEYADVVQHAFQGLLEAIDRFDYRRGVPFRAFASRRITGSVLDGIARSSERREQMAWAGRLQRQRLRSLQGDVPEGGRESAIEILSDLAVGLALGFMLEGTGLYVASEAQTDTQVQVIRPQAYQSLAWQEVTNDLLLELARLGKREQLILRSHYLDGLAFEQIAVLLGVTKGRVSQLHQIGLKTLRKRLAAQGHFHFEH